MNWLNKLTLHEGMLNSGFTEVNIRSERKMMVLVSTFLEEFDTTQGTGRWVSIKDFPHSYSQSVL